MLSFTIVIIGTIVVAFLALVPFFALLLAGERLLGLFGFARMARFALMMVKSLRRNLLRTSLTYLATFVLVMVVVLVWSVLYYLDALVVEKNKDLKVIVSEKWQAVSQLPFNYASPLSRGAANPARPADKVPEDSMTWQFYAGSLDPTKDTRENFVFFIAMEPSKILTMMDKLLDDLAPDQGRAKPSAEQIARMREAVHTMDRNKRGVILGKSRLKAINKRVGERFTLTGINYRGVDLEFEIVGEFPPGKYDEDAIMHRDYLNDALEAYPKAHAGTKHALANRSLNYVWLLVPDQEAFTRIAGQIESSSSFRDPAVRCQTLSSGIALQLDSFRDIVWIMRWLLSPAIVATMTLVISNAISIAVRERRSEIAVLKVLGFGPRQILFFVLGEGLLVGALSGLLSGLVTYYVADAIALRTGAQGIYVPAAALVWAPTLGGVAALAGSLSPALAAISIKVSEVFAKVT
jgi:putative ABC transport system permease protein